MKKARAASACGAALVFGLGACGDSLTDSAETVAAESTKGPGVVEYWPHEFGLILRFEGERQKNDQHVATEHVAFRTGAPSEIDGAPVEVQHVETAVDLADGGSTAGSMTVFQHVDESSTFTKAVQFAEGGIRIVATPMIDLAAPLDPGSSWMSRHFESFVELGITGQVAMTYTSTIVQAGEIRSVAGRMADGCLKVVDAGVSVSDHEATCGDGSEALTKVIVDRTRWWCRGLGGVEELTTMVAVRVAEQERTCNKLRTTYDLVAIDIE